jgi:hypothetical protein
MHDEPVVILPGFFNSPSNYEGMASSLASSLNREVYIAPIERGDWWPSLRGSSFRWYLDSAYDCINDSLSRTRANCCSIVAHSAAGWLARILLGSAIYDGNVYNLQSRVRSLVTLGSPHTSREAYPIRCPEKRQGEESHELSTAARKSSLQFANEVYADTTASFPRVSITSVVGNLLRGSFTSPLGLWARQCYVVSADRGQIDGDGVTPVSTAFLPGAHSNLVLPGVGHDRPFARLGAGWYGSQAVVESWLSAIA